MAEYRVPLGAGVLEDTEMDQELPTALTDLEMRRWRGELVNRIRDFLNTAAEREQDMTFLLDWLTEAQKSLQVFEREEEGDEDEITTQWIEDMKTELDMSMTDNTCCIRRLSDLCQKLFDVEVKKTTKEKAALNKAGVWHWWREQKVDARTIKSIQEFQPPPIDSILADVNLATKSASDLSFMLRDITKSLSCNKAMKMAFKFIQVGLLNLNQAFQERTKEARKHQDQVEEMMSSDCRFELAQMKIQLVDSKVKVTQLEEELASTKEQNDALLFQIRKMQEIPKEPKQETVVIYKNLEQPTRGAAKPLAAPPRLPRKRAKPKKDQPVEEAPGEEANLEDKDISVDPEDISVDPEDISVDPEDISVDPEDISVDPEDISVDPEDISVDPEDILELVEKQSSDLLEDFRNSVFKIIEKCVRPLRGNQLESGTDKATDIIKLYNILQESIRDSFNDIITHLQGKFTDNILDLPLMDDKLHESEFWESSQKSPGHMLKEISAEIQKYDRIVKNTGDSLGALFGLDGQKTFPLKGKNRRISLSSLMDQFKSINDSGKSQVCKMRLTFASLVEMHGNMTESNDKPETAPEVHPLVEMHGKMTESKDKPETTPEVHPLVEMHSKMTESKDKPETAPEVHPLVEMHGKMTKSKDKPETSPEHPLSLCLSPQIPVPPSPPNSPTETEEIEVVEEQVEKRTRRRSILIHKSRKPAPISTIKSVSLTDRVEHYSSEMSEEGSAGSFLPLIGRRRQLSLRPGQTCSPTPPLAPPSSLHTHLPALLPRPPREKPRPQPLRPVTGVTYGVREMVLGQRPAIWQIDPTVGSMWVAEKLPAIGPIPMVPIPRMLELDVNQDRIHALRTLQDALRKGSDSRGSDRHRP